MKINYRKQITLFGSADTDNWTTGDDYNHKCDTKSELMITDLDKKGVSMNIVNRMDSGKPGAPLVALSIRSLAKHSVDDEPGSPIYHCELAIQYCPFCGDKLYTPQ